MTIDYCHSYFHNHCHFYYHLSHCNVDNAIGRTAMTSNIEYAEEIYH